ncbi:hypothetical protein BH11PSE5_BH11PSE5_28120 [soil metagenome]
MSDRIGRVRCWFGGFPPSYPPATVSGASDSLARKGDYMDGALHP